MIASVLSQKYNVLKTEGNFNNEIGLPLTIFKIREQHEVAVLEMGISEFGEMHRLAEMAYPGYLCDHKYRIVPSGKPADQRWNFKGKNGEF